MELPREPTEIPQARRYTRTFHGEQGKGFREQETITINIPRINNTYLTKDTKLHFDFNMTYQEASATTMNNLFKDLMKTFAEGSVLYNDPKAIWAWNYFGVTETGAALPYRPTNVYTKPTPTFDINGPYGLIQRIQVYDYLGNTLLEDIQNHDLITAQFADFWFKDDNMEIDRPRVTEVLEKFDFSTRVRKDPCSQLKQGITFANQPIAVSQFNIRALDDYITFAAGFGITPATRSYNESYSLDLFSFLGRFSDKFVPLHNGYKVVFTVNKFNVPVVFNTPNGNCRVYYKQYDTTPGNATTSSIDLDPSIISASLSNVYIKSDLLEISPELDSKVDKLVTSHAWRYQKDFFSYDDFSRGEEVHDGPRVPFTKRILPDLKSVNKIFIGQRGSTATSGKQNLGFRYKNYTDRARLLFNKSEVSKINNTAEAYTSIEQTMQQRFDDYLDIMDFNTEDPNPLGTNGQQLSIVPYEKRRYIQEYVTANASTNQWWPGFEGSAIPIYGTVKTSDFFALSTQHQGRYLLAFDTRIPGATPSSVAGIDTSKNVLEYEIQSDEEVCYKVDIDVFIEHDSFIFVDPGKSTTVNF